MQGADDGDWGLGALPLGHMCHNPSQVLSDQRQEGPKHCGVPSEQVARAALRRVARAAHRQGGLGPACPVVEDVPESGVVLEIFRRLEVFGERERLLDEVAERFPASLALDQIVGNMLLSCFFFSVLYRGLAIIKPIAEEPLLGVAHIFLLGFAAGC